MFIARMLNVIRNIFRFLTDCQIFVGKHPSNVPTPSIIFFPIMTSQLNCGFAGLMTFRSNKKSEVLNADLALTKLWKKVKNSCLKNILSGKITAKEYLHSMETLSSMEKIAQELKEENWQEAFFFQAGEKEELFGLAEQMKLFLEEEEKILEDNAAKFSSADLEIINSRVILFKDIVWSLEKDILNNFAKIIDLSGTKKPTDINKAAFRKYRQINLLLNSLNRLEVRGRDSAGLQIVFTLKKDMESVSSGLREKGLYEDYLKRSQEGEILNGSICVANQAIAGKRKTTVTFTYKTFSIVGELERNANELKQTIRTDKIFQYFAQMDTTCETALMHTRWASVGSITEENCHPVNNYKPNQTKPAFPFYSESTANINVILNGDIDNYPALYNALELDKEPIDTKVTTDTKIIPLQIEKYLKENQNLTEAFRLAVNDFEGSHAIAMTCDLEPGKFFLALRGSGQSIYVGIGSDQYMFSSELYGLVEVMPHFIKMNGETGSGAKEVTGQIFILDQNSSGGLTGIKACSYDGAEIILKDSSLQKAEITTRDIDRGDYPHFFLKEISESAASIKKTLRGKYRITVKKDSSPRVIFNLGANIFPTVVKTGLKRGKIKNIIVIGHGTAAVAGVAVADALTHYLKDKNINITAKLASELSGFLLKDSLADTLIIPITQSGTTTDTNRAVAMARDRGAFVISIVNRRQSDITSKSHGVFYTSDGRDIEMSVASTKAFYSQIIAGQVLALFIAQLLGTRTDDYISSKLRNMETAPQLMARVFARREEIAASVEKTSGNKFWAIVGSGPNKAAADEIRIKLSELCYKIISSDIVENKKHIDLSAEPLILVCASGNPGPVMEDIVKEVEIFKAHKASVIVFAEEDDQRFDKVADAVIPVPAAPMPLPVILNTMAGHLWGYYAACSINKEAVLFKEFRNSLNLAMAEQIKKNYSLYEKIADVRLRQIINKFDKSFNRRRNDGAFHLLSVRTISDLIILLKYASGKLPLDDFRHEFKLDNGFVSPLNFLDIALGRAIDELTRPIDAIRHQAKTVTVGTTRKETVLKGIIFDLLEKLNFKVKDLTYKNVMTISRIQPVVYAVRGYTLYDINNLDGRGNPSEDSTIAIIKKDGIASQMVSRAETSKLLMGTKRTIVSTGHVYIGKGKADGASIIILPLLEENNFVSNLLLLHVEYNELLSVSKKKEVLGYRYNDIRNLVNEYNIVWDDNYLEKIPIADLFSEPVEILAGQIKQWAASGK
ncbi:MAG: SIS domain-containing protein [Deltaproteobacteria bacterium]|nr:SIS domain-containing protein [Deltaproteobacteria bacterium]